MRTQNILITNDDGINSPGIEAAVKAVLDLGTVTVVAPSSQQTGAGRGLTGDKGASLIPADFMIKGVKVRAFHCDCSPALLVRHSMRAVFNGDAPDLLVSGINYGENLGSNVTCSGTVGAALEAATFGIPSIAVSKQTDIESHHQYTDQDWSASMYFLNYFSKLLLNEIPHSDVDVLKIDVPDNATSATAWKITNLAKSGYYHKEFESISEASPLNTGKTVVKFSEDDLDPSSDIYALAVERIVSVTPLSNDLTSRVDLGNLQMKFVKR